MMHTPLLSQTRAERYASTWLPSCKPVEVAIQRRTGSSRPHAYLRMNVAAQTDPLTFLAPRRTSAVIAVVMCGPPFSTATSNHRGPRLKSQESGLHNRRRVRNTGDV